MNLIVAVVGILIAILIEGVLILLFAILILISAGGIFAVLTNIIPLNSSLKLIEYNWYLDNMDFQKARQCIEDFMIYMDKLIPIYRNEINCERIFLEFIGDCNKEFIDSIYDKNLKKYVKAAKFMIEKKNSYGI